MLYKNGRTLPASAEALQAEADRKMRHSRKLGAHILRANPGTVRPAMVDAHHVVAATHLEAELSRQRIFKVGIGINDADNGVFLPRYKTSVVASFPKAHKHQDGLHTPLYHLSVFQELALSELNQASVRERLAHIRAQLIDGTFPR